MEFINLTSVLVVLVDTVMEWTTQCWDEEQEYEYLDILIIIILSEKY